MAGEKDFDLRIADVSFKCAKVLAILAAAGMIAWGLFLNATQVSVQTTSQNMNKILDIQREAVLHNYSVDLAFYDEQVDRIKNVTKLIVDYTQEADGQVSVLNQLTVIAAGLAIVSAGIGSYFALRR